MDDYDELRRVAANLFRHERSNHTLQPTALVHEAFLRAQGRDGFATLDPLARRAVLAQEMRRALVDHARRRDAQKRGGGALCVSLDEALEIGLQAETPVLDLERALDRLGLLDPVAVRILELHYYGGLSDEEVAAVVGGSPHTIRKQRAHARVWLARELR